VLELCPELREFCTDVVVDMTPCTLDALRLHCAKLESISFADFPAPESELIRFIKGCRSLSKIEWVECNDHTDELPTDALPWAAAEVCNHNLNTLRILRYHNEYLLSITDTGIQALARRCKHLSELTLRDATWVTDKGLIALANGCTELVVLRIYSDADATSYTDIGVKAVACKCQKLAHIQFNNTRAVTDAGLTTLAAMCPHLSSVLVEGTRATDESMRAFAKHCRGLERLDVCNTDVSDEAVLVALTECTQLVALGVSFCKFLTDQAIEHIIVHGSALRVIDQCLIEVIQVNCPRDEFSGCPPGISDSALTRLKDFCLMSKIEFYVIDDGPVLAT